MKELTQAQRDELRETLRDAQEMFREVVDAVDEYVRLTGDSNAKAYLLDHMRIMCSSDHGFLSHDMSMDTLLERLDESDGDSDDGELPNYVEENYLDCLDSLDHSGATHDDDLAHELAETYALTLETAVKVVAFWRGIS